MKNSSFLVRLFNKFINEDFRDTIITFHNILPSDFEWFKNTINLIENKFEIMDPAQIDIKKKNSKKRVLITFDDGFKSNKKLEELILRPKNIKAIFFITTDFISLNTTKAFEFVGKNFFPQNSSNFLSSGAIKENFLPMNWEELKELADHGNIIGAHTKSHPVLSNLTFDDQRKEIIESKEILEKKLKVRVEHFAFPFGSPESVNTNTLDIMFSEFNYNFCNIRGSLGKSNKNIMCRQNISPGMPKWLIEDIINGKLDWLHSNKRKKIKNLR